MIISTYFFLPLLSFDDILERPVMNSYWHQSFISISTLLYNIAGSYPIYEIVQSPSNQWYQQGACPGIVPYLSTTERLLVQQGGQTSDPKAIGIVDIFHFFLWCNKKNPLIRGFLGDCNGKLHVRDPLDEFCFKAKRGSEELCLSNRFPNNPSYCSPIWYCITSSMIKIT